MPRAKKGDPINLLLDYQADYVNDDARWKFGLWSRQSGKDFTNGFEGIRDCMAQEAEKKKIDWLIAAPSERQSLESLEKWKEWAKVFDLAVADYQEERDGGSQALLKTAIITFPHGSRVIAVPGKPDTVRGYCANVLMTEFAFFEDPDATWRAIYPSVTNPLRGLKKIRLITTPNGIGNKAHDLWVKNYKVPGAKWSCHFLDIYSAVKRGLPVDIDELKAGMDDPEGWAQEYECQFMDVQSTLLPYELIATCESVEARDVCPPEFWLATPPHPLVMGIDFGRRRDLTVAWTLQRLGDVQQTVEVLPLERMSTPDQVQALRSRLKKVSRVCLDYTGPGVGLGDYLVKEFGQYEPDKHRFGKIELCTFSNTMKVDVFSKLRMAFEKRALRIPVSRVIREDLHSVNRVATATGQLTYKAPHTADGHADRCTALALAVRAGGYATGSGSFYVFDDTRQSRALAMRGERMVNA
jgi:phage FluMu gp28-like protein